GAADTAPCPHRIECVSERGGSEGLLSRNPIERAEKIPSPGESDHGVGLDAEQLGSLVRSFKGSALYAIVAVLAFTGCRRNEALGLQWCDLDPVAKTLRIERALEETKGLVPGEPIRRLKEPMRASHKCTISIDDALVDLLCKERAKH